MAVVSLVKRSGNLRSFHVANVTGITLRSIIAQNVDRASYLMTDAALITSRPTTSANAARDTIANLPALAGLLTAL